MLLKMSLVFSGVKDTPRGVPRGRDDHAGSKPLPAGEVEPRALTSGYDPQRRHRSDSREMHDPPTNSIDDANLEDTGRRAERLIREAEASRARMIDIPGEPQLNQFIQAHNPASYNNDNQFVHSALVDQNYFMVAGHVDDTTHCKIIQGEYVDFARLLPRDRVGMVEDNRMELINHNGQAFYVPATDRDNNNSINNFHRWELAFWVFSDIYLQHHPTRTAALIQYNHIIQVASLTYNWDNVYRYDREFRLHIAQNPGRSWGIILQQVWSVTLKDKNHSNSGGQEGLRSRGRRDICFRFNSGKCTYGAKCKFDHRCGICGKYGHGAHNCRKLGHYDRKVTGKKCDHHSNNQNGRGGGAEGVLKA